MATPSASAALQTVAAEIRLMIFRNVLRTEYSVIHSESDLDDWSRYVFDTPSLFTVSKQISTEARDAFFEVNTVRLRGSHDLHSSIAHADELQHMEISHNAALCLGIVRTNELAILMAVPRLKTVRVILDHLSNSSAPVRQSFFSNRLLTDLRCVEIGHFTAKLASQASHPSSPIEIRLKKELLSQVLPGARSLALLPVSDIAQARFGLMEGPPCEWELSYELAYWLKNYELLTRRCLQPDSHGLSAGELKTAATFAGADLELTAEIPWRSPLLGDSDVKIQELGPEHGSEVLEWATDLLSLTLASPKDYLDDISNDEED